MKRLTFYGRGGYFVSCNNCGNFDGACTEKCFPIVTERLGTIEDIFGADYNLARITELIEADRNGLVCILPRKLGSPVFRLSYDCDPPFDECDRESCDGCEYVRFEIKEQEYALGLGGSFTELKHPYYPTREEAEIAAKLRMPISASNGDRLIAWRNEHEKTDKT